MFVNLCICKNPFAHCYREGTTFPVLGILYVTNMVPSEVQLLSWIFLNCASKVTSNTQDFARTILKLQIHQRRHFFPAWILGLKGTLFFFLLLAGGYHFFFSRISRWISFLGQYQTGRILFRVCGCRKGFQFQLQTQYKIKILFILYPDND